MNVENEFLECKVLGINSEDVENETDMIKLQTWYSILQEKNGQLKIRQKANKQAYLNTPNEETKSALYYISDFIERNKRFMSLIHNRRMKIKRSIHTKSMHFEELKCFRQIAKRVLSEELYENIKMKAKKQAEENLSE